ncbi:hypothetical protein GCM10011346_00910 [Oceanobacillus neutriphilus]|uniref:Uncharacterized protein n=1 Tax=Oceanobacillus neutriphilus TaxID=531815 RepID=A0ABQ2NP79_9BACI|nr:hypothetical protein GCM10011346_00910 [Oceanobacillus neutriphilus]
MRFFANLIVEKQPNKLETGSIHTNLSKKTSNLQFEAIFEKNSRYLPSKNQFPLSKLSFCVTENVILLIRRERKDMV